MRGRLVLGAFGFQALGALVGTVVGYLVLKNIPEIGAWRWMYATALIPALIVTIGASPSPRAPPGCSPRGTCEGRAGSGAAAAARSRLSEDVGLAGASPTRRSGNKQLSRRLFNKANRRATILASVPWFLQDLGTYGIGIFTPTILAAAIGHKTDHIRSMADLITNDDTGGQGMRRDRRAADRRHRLRGAARRQVGRIRLQVFGFIGCALGLLLASFSGFVTGGPPSADLPRIHAVQLHDQHRAERADLPAGGRGLSDASSRHGRRVRRRLCQDRRGDDGLPVPQILLVRHRHESPSLHPCWGLVLLGAAITWLFRIETTGVNLEAIGAASSFRDNATLRAGAPNPPPPDLLPPPRRFDWR